MKRLSPKFVNRLIVGLLLIAPLVYLFGTQACYLCGAHGNAGNISDLLSDMFGQSNFLSDVGADCINPAARVGFAPFGVMLEYLDANFLHLSGNNLGLMAYGYIYWCAHVLFFDLVFYALVFFVRFIRSLIDKLEVSL